MVSKCDYRKYLVTMAKNLDRLRDKTRMNTAINAGSPQITYAGIAKSLLCLQVEPVLTISECHDLLESHLQTLVDAADLICSHYSVVSSH